MTFLKLYLSHIIMGAAGLALVTVGTLLSKRKRLGNPHIVPHFFYQFAGLVLLLVVAAEVVAILTGVTWQSPFRR